MELIDLITLIVLTFGALIFTVLAFIYRSAFWFGLLSALFWMLFGFYSIDNDRSQIFYYQRELAVVWFIVGIGMLFSPLWFRRKQQSMGEEITELDNTDEFKKDIEETKADIQRYRSLGVKPRKRIL